MYGNDEVVLTLDNYEQRVLVRGLKDIREIRKKRKEPIEDLNDVILKIIDAPSAKRKRRFDRGER